MASTLILVPYPVQIPTRRRLPRLPPIYESRNVQSTARASSTAHPLVPSEETAFAGGIGPLIEPDATSI